MNPQQLRALMQELVNAARELMQSGEAIPDEIYGRLAQTLENLFNRIQQQESGGVPPGPTDLNEAMPSSNVEGFAYDDKTGRLLVRFLGKYPNRNGPIYAYGGVPANIFEIFRRGAIPAKTNGRNKWGEWWQGKYPSIGAAMVHVIKAGGYPYQRISG